MVRTPVYSEHSRRQLRSFAWLFAAVFSGIGLLRFWRGDWQLDNSVSMLWGLAAAFLLVAAAAPVALKPLYHAWMWLAFVLNFVMSRVMLTLLFVFLLTPMALAARLVGRDPLGRKRRDSYWLRLRKQAPKDHFERLFVQSELDD